MKENPAHGETAKVNFSKANQILEMLDPLFFWGSKFPNSSNSPIKRRRFDLPPQNLLRRYFPCGLEEGFFWDFSCRVTSTKKTSSKTSSFAEFRFFPQPERKNPFPASPILISQFQPSALRIQWTFWDLESLLE